MKRILITLLVGSVGGLTGYFVGFPAGALVGSMLAVGIFNCIGFEAYMPAKVRVACRIIIGCLLGLRLNPETVMELRYAIVPALIIVSSMLTFCCLLGFIVYKFCKLDIHTAFFSSSAGGMTELSVLATSLGGEGHKVVIIHIMRILTILTLVPLILTGLEKLLVR